MALQEGSRLFRYYPEDFGELTVRVIHMDLVFDIHDKYTKATSVLTAEVLDKPVREVALNANNLEILAVSCDTAAVTTEYQLNRNLLCIRFDRELSPHSRFSIRTETVCHPSDHLLEGLYYDRTPEGAPPTQISQCQQWGFQRIVPCIDDMTAKCTYTTTIIADERYTNLLSNGDVSIPRHRSGPGRVSITYDNTITPMAPYLFFLCVGTYETFTREFEYPDGEQFGLELLVPVGSDPVIAGCTAGAFADAILWVYLFTGPGSFHQTREKEEIHSLVRERDRLKDEQGDAIKLGKVRERLRELADAIVPGYRYTGTVYREIGMQNSDFGGMENVGNTTITMNRIMPYPQMTDPAFEYMVRVKVHEFYHNLNGSEVTGMTPFELWLNEAVTAFMENRYHARLFGEDYSRLGTVLGLFAPSTGTFALDAGAASLPIEPDGFNDPNDLITGITYVKAAEFVRMIETLMGREQFARGLDRYHTQYRHGNATWQQWIVAMEEVSGQDFSTMARVWLKQTGFPVVTVSGEYDREHRRFRMNLRQVVPGNAAPWPLPFRAALVNRDGRDCAETLVRLEGREAEITFEDVDEPAFLSLNREYSFYGKVKNDVDPAALRLQAEVDSDAVNRFIALYRLTEQEIIGLVDSPARTPSGEYLDLYFRLLSNRDRFLALGGLPLTLYDTVDSPVYAHRYRALYDARRGIETALAIRYGKEIRKIYESLQPEVPLTAPMEVQVPAIKERQIRNICLSLLATLDTPEIHDLVRSQFDTGKVATDRLHAFSLYLQSTAPDRLEVMEAAGRQASAHPVSWEAFLAVVGNCSAPDSVALIRRAAGLPWFRVNQVNDHRALYGSFAANRKISLQTEEGRQLFREILLELAPVNQNSVVSLLRAFGAIDLMEEEYHLPLIGLLVTVRDQLDPDTSAVIHHTIRRLLMGAPKAVHAWESVNGPLAGIS